MNIKFWQYKCYVFDLDNTLYDEREYLFSAYKEISVFLADKYNLLSEDIFNYLIESFDRTGREKLFDKLLNHFFIDENMMDLLLKILRNHKLEKKIVLFPIMKSILQELIKKDKSIYVLTNGNIIQQRNKAENIKWNKIKGIKFVFANEVEPKPSPKGLFFIKNDCDVNLNEMLFIGDSKTDELCALNANVDFKQIDEFQNLKL